MVEAGEDLRLPLEPREPIWVLSEGVRQDLQRDLAVELGVGGLVDLSHAALTDEGRDLVVAERCARTQSHGGLEARPSIAAGGEISGCRSSSPGELRPCKMAVT